MAASGGSNLARVSGASWHRSSIWGIGSLSGEVATQAQTDTARVFEGATYGGLLSNHGLCEDTLAVAAPGNVARISAVSPVPKANCDVWGNGPTILSNKTLDATLTSSGVKPIALSGENFGENDLIMNGNGRYNRIAGSDGDNTLRGFVGEDMPIGAAGREVLIKDAGRDVLLGGSGRLELSPRVVAPNCPPELSF